MATINHKRNNLCGKAKHRFLKKSFAAKEAAVRRIIVNGDHKAFFAKIAKNANFVNYVYTSGLFVELVDITSRPYWKQEIPINDGHLKIYWAIIESANFAIDMSHIKAAVHVAANFDDAQSVGILLDEQYVDETNFDQWFTVSDLHDHAKKGNIEMVKLISACHPNVTDADCDIVSGTLTQLESSCEEFMKFCAQNSRTCSEYLGYLSQRLS
jgi:hypothetical protein